MSSAKISSNGSRYGQDIAIRNFQLSADEPTSLGGNDTGATPFELVLAGLGSCKAITIRMYAERKGWRLEAVDVVVNYENKNKGGVALIQTELFLAGDLDTSQKQRLLEIGDRCPVHRLLTGQAVIETTLV